MISKINLLSLLVIILYACSPASKPSNEKSELLQMDSISIERQSISDALTFWVSFDQGTEADFGNGDRNIYNGDFNKYTKDSLPDVNLGLDSTSISVVENAGKYGAALEFPLGTSQVAGYKLKGNMAFAESNWNGTLSFWMRLNSEEIPNRYCDPIQLTDKDYASDAIWVDITKNDVPPDFRLGFFGDQPTWDPNNLKGKGEEFFFRLQKVSEPPFRKDTWTHVVVTWEKINAEEIGRAKLYINGLYMGPTGPIKEPFNWNMNKATMRLGTGKYVGFFDDIAVFDRTLAPEEIQYVYELPLGITEL
ncbi:MAG: LamG domain-containing protein [Cyclobacteriaceae bacterium]|nr:LamG domain-containing protein [Cyclobacteriaceae bacterium]